MILFFQKLAIKTRLIGVILAFLAVLGAYLLVNTTSFGMAQLRAFAGGGGLLENWFWFTPDQARSLFDSWGVLGRGWYANMIFPLGLILPVVLAILFGLLFLYFIKKISPRSSIWYLSPALALVAAGIDLIFALHERLLAGFLPDFDFFYWSAAIFSAGRWIAWSLCGTLSLFLVIWHAGQRLKKIFQRPGIMPPPPLSE